MREFFRAPGSLAALLKWNLTGCIVIFALLEMWRPCFFLTDDNLASIFTILTGVGRHLKTGQSPFICDYLFGGHYDFLRDISSIFGIRFIWCPPCLPTRRRVFG